MSTPLASVLVLDTCVLLSNVLRRLLLTLAQQSYLTPVWSDVIADEWQRNAAKLWKYFPQSIEQQWADLERAFPSANLGVVEQYKKGLRHSDPKDWHVIAAARAAQAQWPELSVAVVTRNIKDFNRSELRRVGVGLYEPDEYLYRLAISEPQAMLAVLHTLPSLMVTPEAQALPTNELLRRDRLFRLAQFYKQQEAVA
ncbi:PIN domain-containing protein [Alcaligenes endophyticus]|uniref:PIN domain-containing protein n=1 Tax=Alcaligenes endophyticus TaxID=1929088 RepID=A0ABT8EHT2_9BURK|nr:PIN domain-containing protein [Alcaligenes endophyticus]MCX5592185.1 PIN domain-containing protein [Alcaligenes endophyticus]MDN4120832.1 PIN domain-containing protein [Alcaligenes endophyticus]